MRFKNLTITLTLICLSIVAFIGLAMIPVTDGICGELNGGEWKGSDTSPYYYANYREAGKGWHFYAVAHASGNWATASVQPWIYGVRLFEISQKFQGDANVRVWRDAGQAVHTVYPDENCHYDCSNPVFYEDQHLSQSWYCGGHQIQVQLDETEEKNYGYVGAESTLLAEIAVIPRKHVEGRGTYKKWGSTRIITASVTVNYSDYVSGLVSGNYQWNNENGITLTETSSYDLPALNVELPSISQTRDFECDPKARSGASLNFNFDNYRINSTKEVEYTPPNAE